MTLYASQPHNLRWPCFAQKRASVHMPVTQTLVCLQAALVLLEDLHATMLSGELCMVAANVTFTLTE